MIRLKFLELNWFLIVFLVGDFKFIIRDFLSKILNLNLVYGI